MKREEIMPETDGDAGFEPTTAKAHTLAGLLLSLSDAVWGKTCKIALDPNGGLVVSYSSDELNEQRNFEWHCEADGSLDICEFSGCKIVNRLRLIPADA